MTPNCFKARSFILAAVLISSLGLVTHATAQERQYLVDLNTPDGMGGPTSSPAQSPTMPPTFREGNSLS
ncbi:hypothetical protein [Nitrosovibrio sp. Nv6]|uniref:hypothetical protein n=1 Tax=Nitrosovibrio sp. Nv6 TaxID=1855340 RepID=UPI0008BF94C3|nr:hypothetical protein [Nitrosovibrio sp. Nv6]SEP41674.1 hypothetical protein SAMN05216316_2954 [Nitrosovibrio sp. Nv6]